MTGWGSFGVLIAAALTLGAGPAVVADPAMEQAVVERINAIRREHRLPPLAHDAALRRVARDYSCQMAREDFLSHVSPSGGTMADRLRQSGKRFREAGENLAKNVNVKNPVETAVQSWMRSEGHWANVLSGSFTETGVGVCRRDRAYYFTQLFVRPR